MFLFPHLTKPLYSLFFIFQVFLEFFYIFFCFILINRIKSAKNVNKKLANISKKSIISVHGIGVNYISIVKKEIIYFISFLYCFDLGWSDQNFHLLGLFILKLHLFKTRSLCFKFSCKVTHSKFSTLLSVFIQFLWFTCGLFSGFFKNVSATSLWILKVFCFLFINNLV